MTRKALALLVEDWRRILLPEWRVILHDVPLDDMEIEDAWAVCRTPDDYLKIQIHFSDKLLEESREEIEATVVHELIHALTRPWRKQLEGFSYELGEAKAAPLRARQEHEEEQLVDRLAYVFVAMKHGTNACRTETAQRPEAKGKEGS